MLNPGRLPPTDTEPIHVSLDDVSWLRPIDGVLLRGFSVWATSRAAAASMVATATAESARSLVPVVPALMVATSVAAFAYTSATFKLLGSTVVTATDCPPVVTELPVAALELAEVVEPTVWVLPDVAEPLTCD